MKTYQIEIQRLISMSHDKGLIELRLDAQVAPSNPKGKPAAHSVLSLTEKDARSLMILLKQQFAALEQKNKGRSQR